MNLAPISGMHFLASFVNVAFRRSVGCWSANHMHFNLAACPLNMELTEYAPYRSVGSPCRLWCAAQLNVIIDTYFTIGVFYMTRMSIMLGAHVNCEVPRCKRKRVISHYGQYCAATTIRSTNGVLVALLRGCISSP